MKIIVLHDRSSNEPVIINVDAITAVQKRVYRVEESTEEYSTVHTYIASFNVKEHLDVVMTKINNAERSIVPSWYSKLNQGEKHIN